MLLNIMVVFNNFATLQVRKSVDKNPTVSARNLKVNTCLFVKILGAFN